MPSRKTLILLSLLISCQSAFSQVDTIINNQAESTRTAQPKVITDTIRAVPIAPVKKKATDSGRVRHVIDTARLDSLAARTAMLLRDSLRADSLKKAGAPKVVFIPKDTSTYRRFQNNAFLGTNKPAVFMLADYHRRADKDELFYLMCGVLFCLAFIKAGFPKYFRNLFTLFFQTSIRQKQTRDQLLQDNLASLLINLLFFVSAALYVTLLIRYKEWTPASFWILVLASAGVLLVIYLGKYLFLLFAGWVFNAREAAGSYIFLVFMVNKVMGVLLVPFLLVLAFAGPEVVKPAVTVSLVLVGLLLLYRYFVSFNAIRSKLNVNVLHFFLYLCAVEILPLLLIYKLVINYVDGSI